MDQALYSRSQLSDSIRGCASDDIHGRYNVMNNIEGLKSMIEHLSQKIENLKIDTKTEKNIKRELYWNIYETKKERRRYKPA